jgi:hypothetical protein
MNQKVFAEALVHTSDGNARRRWPKPDMILTGSYCATRLSLLRMISSRIMSVRDKAGCSLLRNSARVFRHTGTAQ